MRYAPTLAEDSDMTRLARASWLAALLVVLAAATGARADDPCAADADRFCSGKTPVELLSCLQSHRADLTGGCQDYVEYALVSAQAMIQDCEPDAFQLCRNVGRGEPTATCLSRNQGKLTRRCQENFDIFTRVEAASAKACAGDAQRYCPTVKPGKGDVYLCLVYGGKDLAPACRKAMVR
jgi:hypothetical protein